MKFDKNEEKLLPDNCKIKHKIVPYVPFDCIKNFNFFLLFYLIIIIIYTIMRQNLDDSYQPLIFNFVWFSSYVFYSFRIGIKD